jgi:hypothetical protein
MDFMRKALAILPLCLSLAACDKASSVFGTGSQPQAPAATVGYDFEINTTSPDQALKTWWRYLDTKEAMEYARCQSFVRKDVDEFDVAGVSTGAVEQSVNSSRAVCWRSLYDREILQVKQETDTRAIAFAKITNATPSSSTGTSDQQRARKMGAHFKYLIEKTEGGWKIAQVYRHDESNVLSGDDEWEKQYTPYVETLQSYVSDLQ